VIAAGSFYYAISVSDDSETSEDSGGLMLGAANSDEAEGLTVEDVDAVYYLKGDSTRMTSARDDTKNVRFHEPKKVYGFDDIEIVMEGSVGDRYTLVFGSDSKKLDHTVLVGQPIKNSEISWIPVNVVRCKKLTIYGELYTSRDSGVTVKCKKQGVKCVLKSREHSRAAGVTVEFDRISKNDTYTIFTVTLLDNSLEKTFRVLCVNRSVDAARNH